MTVWKNGQHLMFVLVLLTACYTLGIFIFTQGFLLNRLVVPKYSSCHDVFGNISSLYSSQRNLDKCWMKARFTKAVIIVIDALRHDFMLYNESLGEESAKSYENKLKVIHDILKEKPCYGKLFKFVADPPTTTMQRIKGLTTGSLPTFVDAGSNFASSEITEDNVITQLKNIGKNVVFMGDDTWLGLFPNSFKRSYPFPSFNVKDLHTVDNGVINHLVPELQTDDWDVIIAHFLGVDHCGHRYGPYHKEMAKKLIQMNDILRSVIDVLDNKTLLLVFGDHGMTKTGDHGGDSLDEVEAGLFVYSKSKSLGDTEFDNNNVVSQTDIVPTLSLLLGSPIPFANLGNVIPSLFTNSTDMIQLVQALQLNANQVHRYLTEYSKLSNDIPLKALEKLTDFFIETEQHMVQRLKPTRTDDGNSENLLSVAQDYLTYLQDVRELCRSVWARFDLVYIAFGILVTFLSSLAGALVLFLPNFSVNLQLFVPGYRVFSSVVVVALAGVSIIYRYSSVLLTGVCVAACLFMIFRHVMIAIFKHFYQSWSSAVCLYILVFFLYIGVFFSNSFVVHENKIVLFLLQTLILSCVVRILRNSEFVSKFSETEKPRTALKTRRKNPKNLNISTKTFLQLFLLGLLLFVARLGKLLWSCREEQIACDLPFFVKPANPELINQQTHYHFWISPLLLCVIPTSLLLRLKSSGNLNGNSSVILMTKYALPLGTCFACIHWLLQYLPAKMLQSSPGIGFFQQIIAPSVLYIVCILTIVCQLYKPLMIYFAGSCDSRGEFPASSRGSQGNAVVDIFRRLCSEMNEETNEKLPVVYGLGTVYSSSILICLVCFSLSVAVVLGDGQASSITLLLVHVFGFLQLYKMLVSDETDRSFIYPVITWFLISSHYFFTTGHQATIPNIRFEAAFVGLPGDMENIYLPGFLILLNTFGSDIILAVSLPLIIFWSNGFHRGGKSADLNKRNKQELIYAEHPDRLRSDTFRVCAMYQLCKGLKLIGTMVAATIHRRHLMVWKIFAPRFIFEGVSFIISSVMLVLTYCFVLRVNWAVQSWLSTLEKTAKNKDLMR